MNTYTWTDYRFLPFVHRWIIAWSAVVVGPMMADGVFVGSTIVHCRTWDWCNQTRFDIFVSLHTIIMNMCEISMFWHLNWLDWWREIPLSDLAKNQSRSTNRINPKGLTATLKHLLDAKVLNITGFPRTCIQYFDKLSLYILYFCILDSFIHILVFLENFKLGKLVDIWSRY